jgi:hypothetical protein
MSSETSARSQLQGKYHRPLRARHHQKAADDVRQCEGRRVGPQGYQLCPPEFLLDHPGFGVAYLRPEALGIIRRPGTRLSGPFLRPNRTNSDHG